MKLLAAAMNRVNRRRRALAQALGAAALAATLPRAQAYPSKPIRIVHGFDAGSNPDTRASSGPR